MTIGEKIKLVRTSLGKTQESVADVLQCAGSRVSEMEKGIITPKPSELNVLCKAYNVNPEWLFGSDDQLPIFTDIKQNSRAAIAARIKECRKKLGMTQTTFSEYSGIPRSTFAMV